MKPKTKVPAKPTTPLVVGFGRAVERILLSEPDRPMAGRRRSVHRPGEVRRVKSGDLIYTAVEQS